MNNRKARTTLIAVLAAVILAALAIPWQALGLSLRTLEVLRASAPSQIIRGIWPSLSPEARLRLCPPSGGFTPTSMPNRGQQTSSYRLTRYLFLSCESTPLVANWIKGQLAEGLQPDEADILFFGQALENNGEAHQALTLRKMNPATAIWYVHQGRISIELEHDEATAIRYFQLAQDIDPGLDARKAHMYMYLCMADIREGTSSVIAHPCEAFESIEQSATSESLLGQKLVLTGEAGAAVAHLRRAIDLDHTRSDAFYWAAKAQLELGDTATARQTLEDGRRFATDPAPLALELARLDIAEGCYTAALKTLSGLRASSDHEMATKIARMLDEIAGREDTKPNCE